MSQRVGIRHLAILLGVAGAWTVNVGWSDCNCRSGGVTALSPTVDPMYQAMPDGFQTGMPGTSFDLVNPPISGGMPNVPYGSVAAVPGTNRYGMTPPPGTLSQTYQRRTSLIPDDKHPRHAMINVHLPEKVDVTARGLKPKWTGEVWELSTEEPLLPGRPHIYAIRADWRDQSGEITKTEVRWVRLIMGRVVELDF